MENRISYLNILKKLKFTLLGVLILTFSFFSTQVFSHEEGCIFVPTIAIDEPTVGDELGFFFDGSKNKDEEGDTKHSQAFGVEASHVIFPHFGVSIGTNYQRIRFADRFHSGHDNIELGAKYEVYINQCENFLLSLGLAVELGGTGRKEVGAESHSSVSPALYFGKGLGNIDDNYKYIKPLVFTGLVSPSYCTQAGKIENVELGLTMQYRLRDLNDNNDNSICSNFLNYAIPVVEFPLSVGTTNAYRGKVTGTVNPGILFSGHYIQLGLEATIPINKKSGSHVGVLAQFHVFLDNILTAH